MDIHSSEGFPRVTCVESCGSGNSFISYQIIHNSLPLKFYLKKKKRKRKSLDLNLVLESAQVHSTA